MAMLLAMWIKGVGVRLHLEIFSNALYIMLVLCHISYIFFSSKRIFSCLVCLTTTALIGNRIYCSLIFHNSPSTGTLPIGSRANPKEGAGHLGSNVRVLFVHHIVMMYRLISTNHSNTYFEMSHSNFCWVDISYHDYESEDVFSTDCHCTNKRHRSGPVRSYPRLTSNRVDVF